MKPAIRHRIILLAMLAMTLAGCRSSKNLPTGESLAGAPLSVRYDNLVERSGEWSEINVPVKLDLKQPTSMSVSGRAYMRRDNDIYISLRVLGIEVASIYVNNDSVFAADKINRRYIAEPVSSVLGSFNVSIADIQDILTGRAFILGRGTISDRYRSELTLAEGEGCWTITPRNFITGVKYNFEISDADNNLSTLNVDYKGHAVACNYTDPTTTDCGTFMSQARINAQLKGKPVDAGIRWSWGSAKFKVDSSVRWRTPTGYTRLDAQSIIKILSIK